MLGIPGILQHLNVLPQFRVHLKQQTLGMYRNISAYNECNTGKVTKTRFASHGAFGDVSAFVGCIKF